MTTLNRIINNSTQLLGSDYENLGIQKGIALSYDKKAGWAIVRFDGLCGTIRWIFRCLGFYASTHLSTIRAQLLKESNVDTKILLKIEQCWRKKNQQPAINIEPRRAIPPTQTATQVGRTHGGALINVCIGDITRLTDVRAIVNAANEACLGGGGVDHAIHAAAGPELLSECARLPEVAPGVRCPLGEAVITGSGNLRQTNIQNVIHTVGPFYGRQAPLESERFLRNAYRNSLEVARWNGIRSIAFPAISTGIFGYPFEAGTRVALEEISSFVEEHPNYFNQIKLVFFTQRDFDAARAVWDTFHSAT